MKSEKIEIRISAKFKKLIIEKASNEDETVSEYIRRLIILDLSN